MADIQPLGPRPAHRLDDRPIGRSPADHGKLAARLAQSDLLRRNARGDAIDLRLAGIGLQLVRGRRVIQIARIGRLLDPADAVHQTRGAGLDPRPHAAFVTLVGQDLAPRRIVVFLQERGRKRRETVGARHLPRLGGIGDVAIGQQDDRGHVLHRDAAGLDRAFEGIGRAARGDHRQRRVAVATIDRLVEVRLLGLGRQPGGRTATLRVDDDQRQLGHDGQAHRLALERDARARRRGHPQLPSIGRADRRADRRDLVLGLEGGDAELLELGKVVEDRRGWRDRIAAEEHRQVGQLRPRDQAQADRLGAGDGAVEPGRGRHGIEVQLLQRPGQLGRLAIGMTGVERGDVGIGQHRVLAELVLQPFDQRGTVTVEHPQRQAEGPHVLAAQGFLVAQAERLDRFERQRADVEGHQVPLRQAAVLKRVDLVLGLLEVALGELAAVGNDQAARLERLDIGLQRGRIHRHQHVGGIAGGIDGGRPEVDLEGRDAEQRALRGADFRRKIGKGGQIVAGQRGGQGELPAGELHAVARVAGETHDNRFGGGAITRPLGGVRFGQNSCHSCPRRGQFPRCCAWFRARLSIVSP